MAKILDDTIDFSVYMHETDAKTKVKAASDYIEGMKSTLRKSKDAHHVYLPWAGTQDNFAFRKGEMTVWSGQNGHGKSLITSQIALSLMGQNEKVCIASFEMKPATTLTRMSRMWIGLNPFTPEFQSEEGIKVLDDLYDQFGDWTDNKLWLYDQMGTANVDTVSGMARYCAKELGITHIFIDNLSKCVKGEDDYNGQKAFVDELTAIARDYQVHIHLVHHLKKPENEYKVPDKHDNKGSGSITDQPDNIFLVFRRKIKEDDIHKFGSASSMINDPDQLLILRKQRNYSGSDNGEKIFGLYFHKDSTQYLINQNDRPQFFPVYPHVAA